MGVFPLSEVSRMWFFKKKAANVNHNFDEKDRKESATIRRLKKDNDQLESLLDAKDKRMESLEKDLKEFYEGKQNNQIFTLIEKFLVPKNPMKLPNSQTVLSESGAELQQENIDMPDDKIQEMILNFPTSIIRGALAMGDKTAAKTIKTKYPQLSEKTILRGLELAKKII